MPELVHYVVTETREVVVSTADGRQDALRTAACHFQGHGAKCVGVHRGAVVTPTRILETSIRRKDAAVRRG